MKKIIYLLTLLVFAVHIEANQIKQSDKNIYEIINRISALSEVAHTLQIERGISCGYIASNNLQQKDNLEKSVRQSDKKIALLKDIALNKKLFRQSYLKLKEIRQKITNRTYNFIDTFENYTTIISLIMSRVAYNSDLIENRSLNNRLYKYSSVLLFKESLGQELAILNGLFLGSKLKKELKTYFTIIKAQTSIYRRIFLRTLPRRLKKHYLDDIKSIDIKSYEDKASKILSSDTINTDVDANLWFKTITKKINIIQTIDQKILEDIVLEINKVIPKETLDEPKNINKKKVDVSVLELMSVEELLFILFIFALIAYGGLIFYKKSNILDIKLTTFNILLVLFELVVIFFLIYEIIILDRTEYKLATVYKDKFNMIQAADKLRQSSDDLTHFARTYAVTNNSTFKTQYLDTLAIRNGTKPRPYHYDGIYWDLDKEIREKKHPLKEKLSLKEIMGKLPFTKLEINKLTLSENNSNDLVNLEIRAFEAINNGDNELAIKLLHSQDYYKAKHKIMLPIDDMLSMLNKRTNNTITILDNQIENQFQYILIVSLLFVLGNIVIFIILRKKINQPVEYLTHAIKAFQNGENDIQRETFFNDEIGDMNRDFFKMKEHINIQSLEILKEKKMLESIHKHTRESIEYAALIQGAVVSNPQDMQPFFKDHFVTWTPKDTVGGDIWLFSELRHEDECLLFFIDCTGHGVPGAFVTMIVKAIEREIVATLKKNTDFDISPAIIMSHFNKTMKTLLKQEDKSSISNAGWDGGIVYYNKRTQILKFAGAETPLFYMDENKDFKTIKGNRYSVGYKKCAMDYAYKESIIEVKEGMKFFCTTDGYLDQNGGEKGFPFGKKRFSNIIKEYHKEPMSEIQTIFMMEMMEYESAIENNDRNDDMTVIGFEIGKKSDLKEELLEEIVKYEGVMTQNVIAAAMDNIEAKITNINTMGIVSTITIEFCQNMMNYSKGLRKTDLDDIVAAGKIEVQLNKDSYKIIAKNILNKEDKEKIEPKLIEIQELDKAGIKKRYKELRKSGKNTHEKGGGIGMYEIAKVSDFIEYNFTAISEDKYSFTMKSIVKQKARRKEEV